MFTIRCGENKISTENAIIIKTIINKQLQYPFNHIIYFILLIYKDKGKPLIKLIEPRLKQ
jgi:hypothetical protein